MNTELIPQYKAVMAANANGTLNLPPSFTLDTFMLLAQLAIGCPAECRNHYAHLLEEHAHHPLQGAKEMQAFLLAAAALLRR